MTQKRKYALGGELVDGLTGEDPNDPNIKKRLTPAEIKKKYAENPYVTNGRETWGQSLDATFPLSGGKLKVRDAITNASKQTGISPSLLYTSSMEEGMGFALSKPQNASEAYINWEGKNKDLASKYRVDGFYNYGLDRFGEQGVADNLIKKGYLPADFKDKYTTYEALNEKKEKIKTAAFLSDQDALTAKAAMIRDTQEQLATFSKNKGIKLTDRQRDFFTLAGYNGGFGNMQKMIDSYSEKGYLKDEKFLDPAFKPASYGDIYTNVQRRLQNRTILENEGFFKYGGKMPKKLKKYEDGTEDPIDPLTGKPIPKGLEGAKNMGIDVFSNAVNTPVPINPNAPKDQQIFALDEQKGTPNEQGSIIPLSQFFDQATDRFGNKQLTGTDRYTNDQGGVNTIADQQAANDQISADNLAEANKKEENMTDAEMYASAGITAINAYFNKKNSAKEQRTDRRKAIMSEMFSPVVNPYMEGTGSQAIFKKGGKIDGQSQGFAITDGGKAEVISGNNHSNSMVEFTGKEHKDGGIGIQYGNNVAEVEHKEIGWVDDQGGLNIFGKLKMPGTNMTFKKVAKDIAKQEDKIDGLMSKYTNILVNGDATDPYQETANSTAKVMFKSLDKQSKQIAEKKEALASYQHLILSMTEPQDKMSYGGNIPRKTYENGGRINPEDPKSVQAIIDKYSNGKSPLKAEDFIEVSKKYGVPLDLMLAQAIQESNFGTKGMAARSHNIFNVKNNGNTGRLTDQGSWKQGLENYAKLIRDEYTTDGKTVDVPGLLSSDFKRPKRGGYYAEEKGAYTQPIKRLINEINPGNSYGFSGGGSDAGFKYGNTVFSKKDAQSLYNFVKGDEEHPMNSTDMTDFKRLESYLGISAGGEDPYPKTFKQFKGKDGTQYSSPQGLAPTAFYKDASIIEALRSDQTFPKAVDDSNWGIEHQKVWDALPQTKKDELLQKSSMTNIPNVTTTNINSLDYVPKYEPIDQQPGKGNVDTPYGPAKREATPFSDKVNIGNGNRARGYQSPLAFEQIAPELLTIATNKQDAVEQLTYQPDLQQTFDLSYQLGRNENQSTFNQQAKIAEAMGSVDALGVLAAQKYKADEAYNMQEVQGNAAQKAGVYAQNINTLNDAKVKNLALIADQQNKQAAAKFNTRKEDIGAFTSISGKVLQNDLENKTYNAYANLFQHYGFDKMGNVTFEPDKVAQKFTAGEALQFGMLSAQQGANAIMNGDFSRQFKKVKNDDGSTTTTETLGKNKRIQEEYKTLKTQGFDDNIIGNMLRAKYPEIINQD